MWECAIGDCEYATEDAEELLVHQVTGHERHRCAICGTTVPDGYFAIRHAFSEHSRAEYLRNYEADTDDIRHRETVRRELEAEADVEAVVRRLGSDNGEQEATTQA
jgi:predicted  nucleic acid-binding Zn-ribbon protein